MATRDRNHHHPTPSTRQVPRAVRPAKPRPAPRPDQLAAKLIAAAGPGCSRRIEVPLTAAATGVALLGAPALTGPFLTHLAGSPHATRELRELWQQMEDSFPFLRGHLSALLGWIRDRDPSPENLAALQRCAAVLADVDLHQVATQSPTDGELLGPLYTHLRSEGSRKAVGAFFTPMSVCTVMARLGDLTEGDSFAEPCSGAGAMAVAAAKDLRRRGGDPARVRWVLNDIDPIAVALSGINAAVHGLGPHVWLRCGDGLTLGTDTDPGQGHAATG